ncbi:MAG: prolipoprotein diacylglyceryl transferase [Acutalibacteraceae bacterium]
MHYINFFGLELTVNPIAFTIPIGGGWNVYWYGILITLGIALAVIYGLKRAKSFGIDPDKLMTAILVTLVGAVLSARLYYVIFMDSMPITDFFKIHDGGLAIPGALIGAVAIGFIMCKIEKIDVLSAFDLMSIGFFIGQAIGRWGNFVNQEAYGTFTGSTWFGMSGDRITEAMGSAMPVHPCFFYESIWCALGFLLLHFISYRRKFKGELGCIYMIWYGFGRFIIEGLRTDALMLGAVRVTQWLMLIACIAGAVLLIIGLKKAKAKNNPENKKVYENVFGSLDDDDEIAESGITDSSVDTITADNTDENTQNGGDNNGTDN